MTVKHSQQISSNHVPYFKVYADKTAREADSTLLAADVGKLVKQSDNGELYEILTASPSPTFKIISNLNETQTKRLDILQSSGLKTGGVLSINPSGNTFDVTAGTGVIVEMSDPSNPVVTDISWNTQTNIAIANPTAISTVVTIDKNGTIGQIPSTSKTDIVNNNTDKIILGTFQHQGTLVINSINNQTANIITSPSHAITDLSIAVGPIVLSGNGLSALSGTLSFQKSEGYFHYIGLNYKDDPEHPSIKLISSQSPVVMINAYQNGTGGFSINAPTNLLDVGKWDDGSGTLATLGTNEYASWRFYMAGSGQIFGLYPQTKYSTLNDAKLNLLTESVTIAEELGTTALIGYIIVRGGAVDLGDSNDALFFVGTNNASVATSVVSLQAAYNNSEEPELVTNTTNEAFTVKQGALVPSTINLIEAKDSSDNVVFSVSANGNTKVNISNSKITNTINEITASPTFVTIPGMTVTPEAGTYSIDFYSGCSTDTDSLGEVTLSVDGTDIEHTKRFFGAEVPGGGTVIYRSSISTGDIITFTGSEELTVRHRLVSGSSAQIGRRILKLVKLS